MREEEAKAAAAEAADPWRLPLERVRGKIDVFDNQERVSSQTLLDRSKSHNVTAPQALTGAWRKLWLNSAGPRCACAI
jgi:hypothetical protein